jgi:hypothetical protein
MLQYKFQAKIVTNIFYKALSPGGSSLGTPTGTLHGVHHVAKYDAVVLLHALFSINLFWHYKKEGQFYIFMNKIYVFQHYKKAENAKTCVFRAKRGTLTL